VCLTALDLHEVCALRCSSMSSQFSLMLSGAYGFPQWQKATIEVTTRQARWFVQSFCKCDNYRGDETKWTRGLPSKLPHLVSPFPLSLVQGASLQRYRDHQRQKHQAEVTHQKHELHDPHRDAKCLP